MLKSVLVIAPFATSHLLAADFSGRWAGTLETNGKRVPIYFTLNEHGGKISGSVATGPAPLAIENGEVRNGELSFEDASGLMRFRLKLSNGVLVGEATAGREVSKVAVVPVGGGVVGGGSGTGSGVGCSVYRVGGDVSAPVLIQESNRSTRNKLVRRNIKARFCCTLRSARTVRPPTSQCNAVSAWA